MKLTKDEAIANHRKMWNWIAEETLKQKRKVKKLEYFKAHGITGLDIPFGECYCCEYTNMRCPDCPVKWGGEWGSCEGKNHRSDVKGLYALWRREFDYLKSAELAKQIAELPERE